MKGEIEELKEAMRSYQMEYDQEKRRLKDTIRDVNEQQYHT
jgi:YD repeat-containing protein